MQPLVSIIVPTYNRASLISDTIESILLQSYTNWELIIVDDHSSDNTSEEVSKYLQADKRIKFFLRPSDKLSGGNASRNFGLEKSNGDFVIWLDSDDLLAKNYLLDQLRLILDRKADVVICRTKIFRELNELGSTEKLEEWGSLNGEQSIKDFLNFRLYWHTGAPLWRKTWFKDWKPFDEELLNSQEWLMHLECLLKKPNMALNHKFLCYARYHNQRKSHSDYKKGKYYYHQCLARVKALRLLDGINDLGSEKIKILIEILWFHLFMAYKGAFVSYLRFMLFYPKILKMFI